MPAGIRFRSDGRYVAIWCAGCRQVHGWLPIKLGEGRGWTWDAATEVLDPSVRHFHCKHDDEGKRIEPEVQVTECHYNIKPGGKIFYHADCTVHALRGLHDLADPPAGHDVSAFPEFADPPAGQPDPAGPSA